MFEFVKEDDNLFFGNCSGCLESCCKPPKVSMAPLILDDFKEVYEHFAIVFGYLANELRALIILNDGINPCKYLINETCSIYSQRSPACKIYPLSPFYSRVCVDTSCKAVNSFSGEILYHKNLGFSKKFYHTRFINFEEKLNQTSKFLANIEPDLTPLNISIKDIELFYIKKGGNIYLQQHQLSLKHLNIIL